jgi:TP901 family phage tail tape measure protein
MKIALTFTAIDAASGAMRLLENRILGLGKAGQKVKKDFEDMVSHTQAGLKSLAASYYTLSMLRPGVKIAADMQEAMTELEMSLMRSGKNAATLTEELKKFRAEADRLQKIHPFGAKEFAEAATVFTQAGTRPEDVLGDRGALAAAGLLATIGKGDPKTMAGHLARIGATYGLKGSQYWDLADYMQKVHTSTPLKIEEAVEALRYSGQMSGAMGMGWKDTLTALAVLEAHGATGSMAGTELSNFLQRLTGATKGEFKAIKEAGFEFWDQSGHVKSMGDVIAEVQGRGANPRIGGMSQKERMTLLSKIFAARGERAALAFADTGDSSFAAMTKRIEESADGVTKLDTRLRDLNANLTALAGTTRTAVANAFDPLLNDLTAVVKVANDAVDALGRLAAAHPTAMHGAGYAVGGVAGAAGLYGMYRLFRGGLAASRVLRGLGGMVSTGAGVAEGKLLEKTAGVTPVFVTNWPGGAGGGGTNALETGGAAGLGSNASKLSKFLPAAALIGGPLAIFAAEYELNKLGNKEPLKGAASAEIESWLGHSTLQVESHGIEDHLAAVTAILKEGQKNNITLNVSVDQNGRVSSSSNDPNTSARINLKRGEFFGEN